MGPAQVDLCCSFLRGVHEGSRIIFFFFQERQIIKRRWTSLVVWWLPQSLCISIHLWKYLNFEDNRIVYTMLTHISRLSERGGCASCSLLLAHLQLCITKKKLSS